MAHWLKKHHIKLGYEHIVFVFANTGLENEETLDFVEKCDKHFNLNVRWVEAYVVEGKGNGTIHRMTNYNSASRKGEPYRAIVEKYGIANQAHPHCTRELKERPIKSFGRSYFEGEKYHTAIGIRSDEFDRINDNARRAGYIYPLISSNMLPTKKPVVNLFWKNMPFRLNLKGYQGNCAACWKKSDRKLYQIANENPAAFEPFIEMESDFGRVGPEFDRDESSRNRVFYRKHRSAKDILDEAKSWNGTIHDDSRDYSVQTDLFDNESCEVFSGCSN